LICTIYNLPVTKCQARTHDKRFVAQAMSLTTQGHCKDAKNDPKYNEIKNKIKELFTKPKSPELYKYLAKEDKGIKDHRVTKCALEEATGKTCQDTRLVNKTSNESLCDIVEKYYKNGAKDWVAELDNSKCNEKSDAGNFDEFKKSLDNLDFGSWPDVWKGLGDKTVGIISECFIRRYELWYCPN